MKKTFKLIPIILASILGFSLFGFAPTTFATSDICGTDAPKQAQDAAGCNGNSDDLPYVIVGILNGIIAVLSLVAVIFVIVGGVNYITSSGDTNKLEKAKKTIIYALIGMTIAVLAFALVNFVIVKIIAGQ